ncbi:MAG: hypothetical protein U0800_07630 [Isosphaeraceae bacterium]
MKRSRSVSWRIPAYLWASALFLPVAGCGDDPSKDAGKISVSEAKAQSTDAGDAEGKPKGASKKANPETGRGRPGMP